MPLCLIKKRRAIALLIVFLLLGNATPAFAMGEAVREQTSLPPPAEVTDDVYASPDDEPLQTGFDQFDFFLNDDRDDGIQKTLSVLPSELTIESDLTARLVKLEDLYLELDYDFDEIVALHERIGSIFSGGDFSQDAVQDKQKLVFKELADFLLSQNDDYADISVTIKDLLLNDLSLVFLDGVSIEDLQSEVDQHFTKETLGYLQEALFQEHTADAFLFLILSVEDWNDIIVDDDPQEESLPQTEHPPQSDEESTKVIQESIAVNGSQKSGSGGNKADDWAALENNSGPRVTQKSEVTDWFVRVESNSDRVASRSRAERSQQTVETKDVTVAFASEGQPFHLGVRVTNGTIDFQKEKEILSALYNEFSRSTQVDFTGYLEDGDKLIVSAGGELIVSHHENGGRSIQEFLDYYSFLDLPVMIQ